jgi:hypothetical protein
LIQHQEDQMIFRVGLENYVEGRSIAWVLEHPGCFAYGSNGEAALQALPEVVHTYIAWTATHTPSSWLVTDEVEIQLDGTWEVYSINDDYDLAPEGYDVNSWFLHDWKPLTAEEIERGLKILSWSRADLLEAVRGLSAAELDRSYPGERWNIAGILNHVGGAEWWYMDRLEIAFPQQDVPKDPFERLEKVRAWLVEALPGLAGSKQVVGVDGEFWSPRKLLRRAAWHEIDHTQHIHKLLRLP